jgi:hypothetical protein
LLNDLRNHLEYDGKNIKKLEQIAKYINGIDLWIDMTPETVEISLAETEKETA